MSLCLSVNSLIYNGNISAMDWKVSSETKERGYDFAYDGMSQLTQANYLKRNTRNNRYNTSYTYDKHGNILTLNRHGNQGTTTEGVIDNLSLSYRGNQLLKVENSAANPSLSSSMDFRESVHQDIEYFYDANGNQIKDLNKGITNIEYNLLNLPRQVTFSGINNPVNEYVYSANGDKLTVTHTSSTAKRIDYVGNIIYENGSLKRILVEGGYMEGGIYYYLQDHLGNNRVVAKADGTVIQTNHYYPFGMPFAEGMGPDKQPYKFNGKELDSENRLNWYDYTARHLDFGTLRFMTMDAKAEKNYSWSPYIYCANNPLKFIDPDGKEKLIYYYMIFTNFRHANMYPNNRAINIFAHGNSEILQVDGFRGYGSRELKNDNGLSVLLQDSETWKNKKKGDQLTIILYSCNVAGYSEKGPSLAEKLSASPEFKDQFIIVPDKKFILQDHNGKFEYIGVYGTKMLDGLEVPDYNDMGSWLVYKGSILQKRIPGNQMPMPQDGYSILTPNWENFNTVGDFLNYMWNTFDSNVTFKP